MGSEAWTKDNEAEDEDGAQVTQLWSKKDDGSIVPSPEFLAETHDDASRYLSTASAGQAIPYTTHAAQLIARREYVIYRLVDYLGGADMVAKHARSELDWVMRDMAREMGSSLEWGPADHDEAARRRERK